MRHFFFQAGPVTGLTGSVVALSTWLRAHPQSLLWLFRGSGALLLGLAAHLALQRPL